MIPELDRNQYLMGKLPITIPDVTRVVIGYNELVEKMSIYKSELDDRIIEVMKYYILQKLPEPENGEAEIFIYFISSDQDKLAFHIKGIKKEEIAVTNINFSMYEKILSEIDDKVKTEPFKDFLSPPYISINRIYLES